jgi:hypothetical protein
LTIETHCQHTHDIYVGTRIDFDCGIIQATLDGGAPVTLDTYGVAAQVRRKLFSNVAAGRHTLVITCQPDKNPNSQGWYFDFDSPEQTCGWNGWNTGAFRFRLRSKEPQYSEAPLIATTQFHAPDVPTPWQVPGGARHA